MGKAGGEIQARLTAGVVGIIGTLSLLLATALPGAARSAPAGTADDAEIDPVALASVLISDKHFERARAVLSEVNIDDPSLEIDRPRYYLLLGLALLELGDDQAARDAFTSSLKAGQKDKVVYVFLAQARFRLKDYAGALLAADKAEAAADKLPGMFLLEADSYWQTGRKPEAFETLSRGLKAFPEDDAMRKRRVLLLVDMGLFQQAVAEGTAYLSSKDAEPDEYAAFSEALIKAKRYDDAVVLLESARLRYPKDKNVVIQLARAYMEGGHLFISARLFEHASRLSPELTLDAAELYRRAGRLPSAVRLNARVADQKAKVRQRLGLLIEQERYEEAASLGPRLTRLGLLTEDAVVYGLAYAYFMTGRFEAAEAKLKKISDAALFGKAIQLRRIMGTCSASGWQCP